MHILTGGSAAPRLAPGYSLPALRAWTSIPTPSRCWPAALENVKICETRRREPRQGRGAN